MSTRSRPRHASMAAEPGVPAGGADDGHPLAALGQHVVEQAAQHLHRQVLERQGRAVEQLERPQVGVQLDQRDHGRVGEAGIGLAADRRQRGRGHRVADEGLHHPRRQRVVGQAAQGPQVGMRPGGPGFGHEQPAILRQPGQQHAGEVARGRLAAGGDVSHRRSDRRADARRGERAALSAPPAADCTGPASIGRCRSSHSYELSGTQAAAPGRKQDATIGGTMATACRAADTARSAARAAMVTVLTRHLPAAGADHYEAASCPQSVRACQAERRTCASRRRARHRRHVSMFVRFLPRRGPGSRP